MTDDEEGDFFMALRWALPISLTLWCVFLWLLSIVFDVS